MFAHPRPSTGINHFVSARRNGASIAFYRRAANLSSGENTMKHMYAVLGIALLAAGASAVAMALPTGAPEINPGMAGSGVALVSGMLLLFRSRRAK
jgi:hypothetical protein